MVFKCQEDSFLKEFTSKVVTCEKTNEPIVEYGKTSKFEGYAITLEDTILFPAGGGQPHDIGWLNNVEVLQVLRKGDTAVHFTREPLEPGCEVRQRLDWDRRFDHMQQHSGQHLLSCILETEHALATTSWWLGAEECHVELACPGPAASALSAAEERCNQLIRQALPVTVKMYQKGDDTLDEARTRGLPQDCAPTVRVVCIAGRDQNACCGTHVSNLSQLQAIKILGSVPGKPGKTNVRFAVGGRVLSVLAATLARERALTGLLNNEPKKHEELVQKLQRNLKIANKSLQSALGELARAEVDRVGRERPRFVLQCRRDGGGGGEYVRALGRGLEREGGGGGGGGGGAVLLVAAAAEPGRGGEGQLLLQGPAPHCEALATRIAEILKAKGAFKNGKFQGRAADLSAPALARCHQLLHDYFDNL